MTLMIASVRINLFFSLQQRLTLDCFSNLSDQARLWHGFIIWFSVWFVSYFEQDMEEERVEYLFPWNKWLFSPVPPNQNLDYIPGIYAKGYIVRMLVRYSVTLMKVTSKFCVNVSQMGISQQPLIRKHSYLGHGYLGGSAGQNLGHPKKVLYCFFFYAYPFLRH